MEVRDTAGEGCVIAVETPLILLEYYFIADILYRESIVRKRWHSRKSSKIGELGEKACLLQVGIDVCTLGRSPVVAERSLLRIALANECLRMNNTTKRRASIAFNMTATCFRSSLLYLFRRHSFYEGISF